MNLVKTPHGYTIEIDPNELVTTDAYVFVRQDGKTENKRCGTLGAMIAQSAWSRLWMKVPEVRGRVKAEALNIYWDEENKIFYKCLDEQKILN